tara:strand:- start:579 stop:1175 length:597 start_codon:yes stop_codon:yes gene_type:complete
MPASNPKDDPIYDNTEFLESGRGQQRASKGPILAIQNFFETQEEIKALKQKDKQVIQTITNEVGYWNEETINLNMDWSWFDFYAIEAREADSKDNPKPDHSIHTMNLNKDCRKWSAIVNCSSRDDIQGGELIFKDWKRPFKYDNYGKVIGNPDECQPQWINELGTLILFPSIAAWGYHLVVSGGFQKVHLCYNGKSFS